MHFLVKHYNVTFYVLINSAFVGKNSFVLIKMHGKTTIKKTISNTMADFDGGILRRVLGRTIRRRRKLHYEEIGGCYCEDRRILMGERSWKALT